MIGKILRSVLTLLQLTYHNFDMVMIYTPYSPLSDVKVYNEVGRDSQKSDRTM